MNLVKITKQSMLRFPILLLTTSWGAASLQKKSGEFFTKSCFLFVLLQILTSRFKGMLRICRQKLELKGFAAGWPRMKNSALMTFSFLQTLMRFVLDHGTIIITMKIIIISKRTQVNQRSNNLTRFWAKKLCNNWVGVSLLLRFDFFNILHPSCPCRARNWQNIPNFGQILSRVYSYPDHHRRTLDANGKVKFTQTCSYEHFSSTSFACLSSFALVEYSYKWYQP